LPGGGVLRDGRPHDRRAGRAARARNARPLAPSFDQVTPARSYRYYEFVMAAFVTILICSNLIGPAKIAQLDLPLLGAVRYGTGILPNDKLPAVMLAQFVGKVAVEVVFTPLTYKIVGFLKRAEQEDYYDRGTDFNPFVLKD